MVRRILLGILCAVLLTAGFYFLKMYLTMRINRELARVFPKTDVIMPEWGKLQTDFLTTLKVYDLNFNLQKYLFLSRLHIGEIVTDFNAFLFLKDRESILGRVSVLRPTLYVRSGDFKTGLERLLEDLCVTKITSDIEIQDGTLVVENNSRGKGIKIENIWGHIYPGSGESAKFIITNQTSASGIDSILLKGEISFDDDEGEIHAVVKNLSVGPLLSGVRQTGPANIKTSFNVDFIKTPGRKKVNLNEFTLTDDQFELKGKGKVLPDKKGAMQLALNFRCAGQYHVGDLSLEGDLNKPMLKGSFTRRNSDVNEGKILVRGFVNVKDNLEVTDLKIESDYGKLTVNGLLGWSSVDLDFIIREKIYNNVSFEGHMIGEAVYQETAANAEENKVKVYLSKLKLNGSRLSDVFLSLAYNELGFKIYETRGNHAELAGDVSYESDEPRLSFVFKCEDANLAVMKPVIMKGRSSSYLSGQVSGAMTIDGPLRSLGGKGHFEVMEGSIGMIPKFEKMVFDFTWKKFIIILNDARIIREKDYFVLKNTIDLARRDIMETVSIEHVGESKEWEGWTVKSPKPELGYDIFGSLGHAGPVSSGADEEEARKTLLDLEYDLEDGKELLFKIENEESFLGVGKKIEF